MPAPALSCGSQPAVPIVEIVPVGSLWSEVGVSLLDVGCLVLVGSSWLEVGCSADDGGFDDVVGRSLVDVGFS